MNNTTNLFGFFARNYTRIKKWIGVFLRKQLKNNPLLLAFSVSE
jgi:hypothetical protein